MTDMIGQTIGNYRIEALLGRGAMGQVFLAHHNHLDRRAAIKLLYDSLARDADFLTRFRKEARDSAALQHPNIIKVEDFGEERGRGYLVLELCERGSVRGLIQHAATANSVLPLSLALDLVRQTADGLNYAHERGMVHRDIKPDNILIQYTAAGTADNVRPVPKISDFGLAQLADADGRTTTSSMMGTPAYMSPEQCQGLPLDGRSDIYALGIVLYELATGYLPFQVKNLAEAVYKHVYEPPPLPRQVRVDLPEVVEAIILRCLAKRADERYATAAELSSALQQAIGDQTPLLPIALMPDSLLPKPAPTPPKKPVQDNALIAQLLAQTSATEQGSATPTPRPPAGPRVAIELEHGTLTLTPGQPTITRVTVHNIGDTVDWWSTSVEGVPEAWVRGPNQPVQLNPGNREQVLLTITVPRMSSSLARDYPVTLRARSRNNPADFGTASAVWTVLPFAESSLTITPLVARGREQATYTLRLHNKGNRHTRYDLDVDDDEQALNYVLAEHITLDPGKRADVEATVLAARRLIGGKQIHRFTAQASAKDERIPPAAAQFEHRALIPTWVPPVALALLLVLCIGLYNLIARPPTINGVAFDPINPLPGQPVTVRWAVEGADRIEFRPLGIEVEASRNEYTFAQGIPAPGRFTLIASNRFGSDETSEQIAMLVPTLEPTPEPGAPVVEFRVSTTEVALGQPVVLIWKVRDAESVLIEQFGNVETEGQIQDTPQATTAYKLIATNKGKTTTKIQQVNVINIGATTQAQSAVAQPPTVAPPDVTTAPLPDDPAPEQTAAAQTATAARQTADAQATITAQQTADAQATVTTQQTVEAQGIKDQAATQTAEARAALGEDCIGFDYQRAEVQQVGGRWKIVVGNNWLLDFDTSEAEARSSLAIIQQYKMNDQCFVGRPNPSMTYFLVDGSAPVGLAPGEDCIRFNPDTISVTNSNGEWFLVDGNHSIRYFANLEDEARKAFNIIRTYRFEYNCFVGRPDPSLVYLRR